MKRIIAVCLLLLTFCVLYGCNPTDTTEDTTSVKAKTTAPETEPPVTEKPETKAPEKEIVVPDYFIDFRDPNNVLSCTAMNNVALTPTEEGMKVSFLASPGSKICDDPYFTMPVPFGRFSISEYPYVVLVFDTPKANLPGILRFRTDGLTNKDSYPSVEFSYFQEGYQKIVLDLDFDSEVKYVAAEDRPTSGNYTHFRLDCFENEISADTSFTFVGFAFFETRKEARAFTDFPKTEYSGETVYDLTGKWLGEQFTDPSAIYRARKLLYNFSDNYTYDITTAAAYGFGGVVTNVKFDSNYLKDDAQFKLVKDAFAYAQKNGLRTWIYDEYQWPSGKAFGQVLEGHPEYEATGVELLTVSGKNTVNYTLPDGYISILGATLKTSAGMTNLDAGLKTVNASCNGDYTLYVYARRITNRNKENPADFRTLRDVDILNPTAVKRFIDLTYVKYKNELGDSFDAVDAFFTDEPLLGNRDMEKYIVWTDGLPEKFKAMHGYDITENFYSLYLGTTAHDRVVRVNFYQTVSEMFKEAYTGQISNWCEENGTKSSGHMLFEEQITKQIETLGGDLMQIVGVMGIPGADILHVEAENLMDASTDIGSFMGMKYISSAAKNAGKTEVMLEFSPMALDGSPFEKDPDTHSIAGATLATFFGCNRFNVICPDSGFTVPALRKFNKYIGRINALLDTAVTVNSLAVFAPVNSVRADYNASVTHTDYNGKDKAAVTNRKTAEFCKSLITSGLDFTFIDEQSIASGTVNNGKIKIGLGEYSVIAMPCAEVMGIDALKKLSEFEKSGGQIIWIEKTPELCTDERDAEEFAALVKTLNTAKKYAFDSADGINAIKAILTSDIKATLVGRDNLGKSVFISEYYRADGDKQIFFIANSATKKTISLSFADGRSFDIYIPYTGEVITCTDKYDYLLESYQGILIVCDKKD